MVSMMHLPLFAGQRSRERYSGSAFYSSSPWRFHQEFLFVIFRIARRAALRQVPVRSHEGRQGFQRGCSLVCTLSRHFQRVHAVFKIAEEIEVQAGRPSCRSLIVFFMGLIGILLQRFFRSTASSLPIVLSRILSLA